MPQHAIEVDHHGQMLRGMCYTPAEGRRHPTVLLLHGFTGQRMENGFLFVRLARALAAAGMAAVTFDFMHSGESDGSFEHMLVSGEIADALRMTEWLGGQPFVDRSRIGLLGFSLGGLVASCVSGQTQAYRALMLLAPTTVSNLDRVAQDDAPKPVTRGPLTLHGGFFEDLRLLDPLAAVVRHPRPTLLVQGLADTAVPPDVAREYLQAMQRGGVPVNPHWIEQADHTFSQPPLRAQLVRLVTGFAAEQLRP